MGEPVGAVAVGNWKAKRNGRIAEMLASILYDTEISTNAVIDGHYQGRPLEVKACQQWVTDASNSKSRRRGRFWIAQKQHKELLEGDGFYAFFVLDENGDYLVSKLVSAHDISKYAGHGRCFLVPWTRVFPELVV